MQKTFYLVATLAAFGGSYVTFVQKQATVYASLWTVGWSGVLAFGSLQLTTLDGGSEFTFASEPMAILWTVNLLVGALVFVASLAGQYGEEDDSDTLTAPEWQGVAGLGGDR